MLESLEILRLQELYIELTEFAKSYYYGKPPVDVQTTIVRIADKITYEQKLEQIRERHKATT